MYIDQFCILGGTPWSNKERTNRQFSKCSETLSNHSLQWTLATNAIMMLVHCQVYHRVRRFFRKETLLRPFESPKLIPIATKKGLTLVHRIMYSPSTRALVSQKPMLVRRLCLQKAPRYVIQRSRCSRSCATHVTNNEHLSDLIANTLQLESMSAVRS